MEGPHQKVGLVEGVVELAPPDSVNMGFEQKCARLVVPLLQQQELRRHLVQAATGWRHGAPTSQPHGGLAQVFSRI